jgi:GntR family transcriptional regulator
VRFQINFKSGKPVYLQIVDQVKTAAASGAAQPGEPLPSIRPLAEELRVNRNTIAKAYAELEHQGVIETAPGKGSVIGANNSPLKKRRSPQAPRPGDRRRRRASASSSGWPCGLSAARRRTVRHARRQTHTRSEFMTP